MALQDKVATALLTHPGRVRTNNEDAIAEDPQLGLLVLADGMGGYNAGEIASGIAVATILDIVRRDWDQREHGQIEAASGYSSEALLLRQAVETAHSAIQHVAESQPQCQGMGTTVVCCLLHDDRLSIAYVGDSRLYRLREGELDQITRDHSLLEELVARGHYTREEAGRLVRKNIVTRALGVESSVEVDLIEDTLQPGDIVLLCSDGLCDLLSDEEIALTLRRFADNLPKAASALVDAANAAGGKDNIAVILARLDQSLARGKRWYERFVEWF